VKREELGQSTKLTTFWEVYSKVWRKCGTVYYDLKRNEPGVNIRKRRAKLSGLQPKGEIMNTPNIFTKLSIAIALIAIASAATVWEVRRVKANPPPDPERAFGMVGITSGQTMRLNVVNLSPPPDPDAPPGPCRVLLSFRDSNGQPFNDSNGQVFGQVAELQAGQSAFLDLNGDLFAGGISTNGGPARLQLRPVVRVLSPPPDPEKQYPPGPCRSTMEVFDNVSGRTSIFASFEPPPDPDRGNVQQ